MDKKIMVILESEFCSQFCFHAVEIRAVLNDRQELLKINESCDSKLCHLKQVSKGFLNRTIRIIEGINNSNLRGSTGRQTIDLWRGIISERVFQFLFRFALVRDMYT